MKIIHLTVDDKFIDGAIREFEAAVPGIHEYLIVGRNRPFRYVRSTAVREIDRAGWIRRMNEPDVAAVILHGLPASACPLLLDVPPRPKVFWLGWGYDYYGLLSDAFPEGLLMRDTAALVARLHERVPLHRPGLMAASELSVARPYPKPSATERLALGRVDYFSALEEEWRLLRRHQPTFRAEFLEWNYLTMEDDLVVERASDEQDPVNILVGNSAAPSNNHLEAFELIRRSADLSGRRLIVPLSYGDERYADAVVAAGTRLFGSAFVPLREYLPREDYIRILGSCGFAVMNHVRQQAIGNVLTSGLLGARLFLNPLNPVGRWIARRGVAWDDVARFDTVPLTRIEQMRNIEAIARFTARNARRPLTRRLVARALEPRAHDLEAA